ncbi:hypothetical protein DFH09DRAFT_1372034 [Mycena vulgaris]|nr:hypothetical protein DFH09DRAFT_1372034 [Mycena vulgaris]
MSVQELQARIEEVSADIERQKEVLKKLEKSKSALQRQLNDVCDPVARLPLEISSTILTLCLPSLPRLSALQAPLLFLYICNAWTVIAVSTPALWATIHIEFPRSQGFNEVLGTWLKRARSHSLSISLHGTFDEGVAAVVRRHTEHLKGLEIFSDYENAFILPTRIAPFPSLEAFTFGSLPDVDGDYYTFTDSEILDFLCLTPNLVECTFTRHVSVDRAHLVPPGLALPSLRHLRFGTVERQVDSGDAAIIRDLSLPALETLFLPIHNGF